MLRTRVASVARVCAPRLSSSTRLGIVPQRRCAPGATKPESTTARTAPAASSSSTSPPPAQARAAEGASAANPEDVDLLEAYRALVAQGRLTWDDEQVRVVMKLRHVLNDLCTYTPPFDLLDKLGPTPPRRAPSPWWRGGGRGAVVSTGSLGSSEREKALVRVLTGDEEIAALTTPRGILLTGPPGTGKSLLLSLLFDALPPGTKARHHYHAFTLGLYARVFAEMERRRNVVQRTDPGRAERLKAVAGSKGWKAVFAQGRWEEEGEDRAAVDGALADPRDTIPFVIAKEMIQEYHVLYFDELQLVDASSAAIMRDVLSWYWRLGGVVLSCSNRVPDDLYHHGVQRERMAGFLDSLKGRCEVVQLDGGRDWRRLREVSSNDTANDKWVSLDDTRFDAAWEAYPGAEARRDLVVYGRRVPVEHTKGDACRFPFADLCETTLGPADYLTLSSTFRTFFIDGIPELLVKNKNEARRLINLIDALYESRCQLHVRGAARPEHIFFPDALDPSIDPEYHDVDVMAAEALSETLAAQPRANVSVYNPTTRAERERLDRADMGSSFAVTGIFTGEDERFAYKRAVSRLVEMTTSPIYAAEPWLPLAVASRRWEVDLSDAGPLTTPAARGVVHSGDDVVGGLAPDTDSLSREAGAFKDEVRAATEPTKRTRSEDGEGSGSSSGPRAGAPRIKDVHAWGVEEGWGPKAGRWGKGASVFEGEGGGEERK